MLILYYVHEEDRIGLHVFKLRRKFEAQREQYCYLYCKIAGHKSANGIWESTANLVIQNFQEILPDKLTFVALWN